MAGDAEELAQHSAQPWRDAPQADPVDVVPAPVAGVFRKLGVRVRYRTAQGAYYAGDDGADGAVTLPRPASFRNTADFARTAFHELGHWTMHPTRVGRMESVTRADYDTEELVAELVSAYLMAHFGLADDVKAHAGYLLGYTRELEAGFALTPDYIGITGPCVTCHGRKPLNYAIAKAREATAWILERLAQAA
jgi:antirestriction protein ArdC